MPTCVRQSLHRWRVVVLRTAGRNVGEPVAVVGPCILGTGNRALPEASERPLHPAGELPGLPLVGPVMRIERVSSAEMRDGGIGCPIAMELLRQLEMGRCSRLVDTTGDAATEYRVRRQHELRLGPIGGPVPYRVQEKRPVDRDLRRRGRHLRHALGKLVRQLGLAGSIDLPGPGELGRPDHVEIFVDPDRHRDIHDPEQFIEDMGLINNGDVGHLIDGGQVRCGSWTTFDVETDRHDVDAQRAQFTVQGLPPGEVSATSSPGCPSDHHGPSTPLFGEAPDTVTENQREFEVGGGNGAQGPAAHRCGTECNPTGGIVADSGHSQRAGDLVQRGRTAERYADLTATCALGLDVPPSASQYLGGRCRLICVLQQHGGTLPQQNVGTVTSRSRTVRLQARDSVGNVSLRSTNVTSMKDTHYDVLIVGGGINGAVSAAALASRGASVALVDRGDFAGFTSQESSNLVWGGFKYLENYELPLVRKLCMSRNRLMKAYPANVAEVGFLAALGRSAPFPPWLAAAGSFAYWAIGNFKTNAPRPLSAESIERLEPVINTTAVRGGVEYADAYLKDNDARFVFGFIRGAMDLGAVAANYVELVSASRSRGQWVAQLRDLEASDPDAEFELTASTVVNAAGPFVDGLNASWELQTDHRIVYSKGIHLVVDQITPNERVLAFFDDTRRLFYVIPMGKRSVIGTTDTRVDTAYTEVNDEDRTFLLDQINARLDLARPLTKDDVIAERCGVRPLVVRNDAGDQTDVDWTSLSRKHQIEVDTNQSVISVFGGKLTDCLNVGEEVAKAAEQLGTPLGRDSGKWYGEPGRDARRDFYRQARGMRLDQIRDKPGVEPLSDRLWRRYGRRAFEMLDDIREDPAMAEDIMGAADYLRVELHHTAANEMVTRLDDFLRRRSKIALVTRDEDVRNSPGLYEVAQILFGDRAEEKLVEHFGPDFIAATVPS
jgi:glycerol-3-phosphate dehydrogenase